MLRFEYGRPHLKSPVEHQHPCLSETTIPPSGHLLDIGWAPSGGNADQAACADPPAALACGRPHHKIPLEYQHPCLSEATVPSIGHLLGFGWAPSEGNVNHASGADRHAAFECGRPHLKIPVEHQHPCLSKATVTSIGHLLGFGWALSGGSGAAQPGPPAALTVPSENPIECRAVQPVLLGNVPFQQQVMRVWSCWRSHVRAQLLRSCALPFRLRSTSAPGRLPGRRANAHPFCR